MSTSALGHSSRLVRLAVATAVLLSAIAARQLALPASVFACSCAAPDPGAPAFTGDEQAVFIGTAGQPQPDGTYRFAVERWFAGGNAAEVKVTSEREPMPDGGVVINTCGLHFEVGDRLIMAAGFANGVYSPGLCSPHAVMNSDEGARLVEAATAAFGAGAPPGAASTGAPPTGVRDGALPFDLATAALIGVGLIVLVALFVVGYAATRRGSGTDSPA